MDSREAEIRSVITWYTGFHARIGWSREWQAILKALLSKFETHLLQKNDRINWLVWGAGMLKTCLFYPETTLEKSGRDTIYFWPFQFLHCDFLEPVVEALRQKGTAFEVLVFRQDLAQYLKEKGIACTRVQHTRKRYGMLTVIKNLTDVVRLICLLGVQRQPRAVKKAMLNTWVFAGAVQQAQAAIRKIADPQSGQYHVVGYDLSIMGSAIIQETNFRGLPSGRIQNGAPNYLLAGYSEVSEIFLWDQLSAEAYHKEGYAGKVVITGNPLLYRKLALKSRPHPALEAIGKEKPALFVAFSGPGHNTSVEGHVQSLNCLAEIIENQAELLFLIKLHPKDSMAYYHRIQRFPNVCFTDVLGDDKPDALDCLLFCEALITGASTVALDAFQLNKPVIHVDPTHELHHFQFLQHPLVIKYHQPGDLDGLIQDILLKKAETKHTQEEWINPAVVIAEVLAARQNGHLHPLDHAVE